MNEASKNLLESLQSLESRHAFVVAQVQGTIGSQILTLRQKRKWTQKELGEKAGGKSMMQSAISRLENISSRPVSVQTLIRLAKAFDVGLLVKFVPYSALFEERQKISEVHLDVPSYENDERLRQAEEISRASRAESVHGGNDGEPDSTAPVWKSYKFLKPCTDEHARITQAQIADIVDMAIPRKSDNSKSGQRHFGGTLDG